ncbi:hypothetical protein [Rossellomorea marisflavi]|uniref:hypothetical protein n=1 Tax=Rossellomorea marisflavi TaxID=189381 RepID=UPI0034599BBE
MNKFTGRVRVGHAFWTLQRRSGQHEKGSFLTKTIHVGLPIVPLRDGVCVIVVGWHAALSSGVFRTNAGTSGIIGQLKKRMGQN